MQSNNEARFRNAARMDKETFMKLVDHLKVNGGIRDSKHLNCFEKVLIYIHVVVGHSLRQTAERFQHSSATISKCIHEVANALMTVKDSMFVMPKTNIVPEEILLNPKRFPFFKHCIGALDGTHIPAMVNSSEAGRYRNRKGFIDVVNFDMTFSFVLARWEGSAHDSKVLSYAMTKGLTIYERKYYLGDAGCCLKNYCLTP